jgi:hypothetical protein
MTAATATPQDVTAEEEGGGIPWPLYPLAPFVILPAVVIGLWLWPAIAFGALTVRRAVKIKSNAWAIVYGLVFALVFIVALTWPFLLMWGLSELL